MPKKINILTLLLAVFAFSLQFKIFPYIIGVVIALYAIIYSFQNRFQNIRFHALPLLFLLFFLLTPLSFLYSEDVFKGTFFLEKRMFFALPLLISIVPYRKINFVKVAKSYIAGVLFAVLLCIIYAVYNSYTIVDGNLVFNPIILDRDISFLKSFIWGGNYFSYSYLSAFLHPAYFAVNILFAFVVIYWMFEKKMIKHNHKKWYIFISILFVLFFLFLSVRAAFLSFIVLSFIILVKQIINSRKKKYLFISIPVIVLLIAFVFLNPRFKAVDLKNIETSNIRIQLWKATTDVIEENFWIGTGSGSADIYLTEVYKKHHIKQAVERKYSAHNQFIQTFVEHGIVGFMLLIVLFSVLFIHAIRQNNFLLFLFITILIISYMFESMLNRMIGCQFFGFWSGVLLYLPKLSKPLIINESTT